MKCISALKNYRLGVHTGSISCGSIMGGNTASWNYTNCFYMNISEANGLDRANQFWNLETSISGTAIPLQTGIYISAEWI